MIEMRILGCKTRKEVHELRKAMFKALYGCGQNCLLRQVDEDYAFEFCIGDPNDNDISFEVELSEN